MSILNTVETPGNVAAVSAIAAAVFNALPTVLGIIAGICGIAWYGVLFYDRFSKSGRGKAAADKEGG